MKAAQSYLIGAAIFCGCAASVWAIRGGPEERATSPAASESSPRKPSKTARGGSGKVGVPQEVTERLAAVRAGRTAEDRLRATIQLAESIPVGDLEKWFKEDWFDGREGMQRELFQRIARARWLAADPEGLMNYCLREKSNHGYEVVTAWAKKDPAAALNFVAELKDPAQRSTVLSNMGSLLAKADPQLALDSISKLAAGLDTNQLQGLSTILHGLAESSPGLLKAKLDELPDSLRASARIYLTRAGLKRDFRATVAELSNSPGGRKQLLDAMNDSNSYKELLKNLDSLPKGWFPEVASKGSYFIVRDDPKKWLDTDLAAMDFSPQQARSLRSSAMSALAEKDPEQLMALLSGEGLNENDRRNGIRGMVSKLASDKEKAEAWIATLTDEKEIALAKDVLTSNTPIEEKDLTPTSLLASLTEDGAKVNSSQARAVSKWNGEQLATLSKEFAGLPAEQKQKAAGEFLESRNSFPTAVKADALRYLLENPKPAAEPGSPGNQENSTILARAASAIGSSWAEENPNEAGRWVNSLPAGTERLWAAKNLAARWSEYEPSEARKWLDSLPGEERAEVQKYLDSGQAHR